MISNNTHTFTGASIVSGTTVLTGIDRITGVSATAGNDVINLSGIVGTYTGAAGTTIASATGNTIAVVRGSFNTTSSVFTADAAGADSLLVWDADGLAGAGTDVSAVVLVGYASTGTTAALGVVTLGGTGP